MNYFTQLFILAVAVSNADSSPLRGPAHEQAQAIEEAPADLSTQVSVSTGRRHLVQESTCTLYKKCVTYPPTDEHPDGHHHDSWVCQLNDEDSDRMQVQFVDIVETNTLSPAIANATSGESQLTVSEAIIDTESPRMFIPKDAKFSVTDSNVIDVEPRDRRNEKRRRLSAKPPTKGTLKTLVIRLKDNKNRQPPSTSQLKNDVFDDAVSLKSQTQACSYGKLKIEPFTGKTPSNRQISNGIVDVQMDFDMASGTSGKDQKAMQAAKAQLGDLNDPRFDLLIFCFPPGSDDFVAYAFPNSKYSFYNDKWCGYSGPLMHEVGHNIGLAHSGETAQGEYGDGIGVMGSSPGKDDNRMCYNSAKNFQLGWYDDKVDSIYPLDGLQREYKLNGVDDYKKSNDATMVVRLKQPSSGMDYYVGYNRPTGINSDTTESFNMVTITKKDKGGPTVYGQSTKIANLLPGDRYVFDNYDGKGKVVVWYRALKNGDARVVITNKSSTQMPKPNSHCKKFTVEILTDHHPEDTSWYIVDTDGQGSAAGFSPKYTTKNKKSTHQVCLPMGPKAKTYKFVINDSYKDGLQGAAYYKVWDGNSLKASGGKGFGIKEHSLSVPKDSNPLPPTKAPTQSPTNKPTKAPDCEVHTVEIKTDRYPTDTSWEFVMIDQYNDEFVVGEGSGYNENEKVYKANVCLTEGRNFQFRIKDKYGDGLCCGAGKGSYKVTDSRGDVVKSGDKNIDSGEKSEKFKEKSFPFTTSVNNNQCTDIKKGRFQLKDGKGPKRNCKQHAKKKKCNKKLVGGPNNGKFLHQLCPKSCNKC